MAADQARRTQRESRADGTRVAEARCAVSSKKPLRKKVVPTGIEPVLPT
jgi:hypothetical protein